MYSKIEEIAHANGFDFICDGNNISDLVIDRPGILITYKHGFKTPFIEAKLTSKEIHDYISKIGSVISINLKILYSVPSHSLFLPLIVIFQSSMLFVTSNTPTILLQFSQTY